MKSKPKKTIVCLILSIDKSPWREIQELGQNQTFAQNYDKDIVYLRYQGHDSKMTLSYLMTVGFKTFQHWLYLTVSQRKFLNKLSAISLWRLGDKQLARRESSTLPPTRIQQNQDPNSPNKPQTILTQSVEHGALIGIKTLHAFRYVLHNYDFDYIFRTNSSSYVDGELLVKKAKTLPEGDFYGGVPGAGPDGPFASGAGILLSKSVIEKVLAAESCWRHGLIDDVALSQLIKECLQPSIVLQPLPRMEFGSIQELQSARPQDVKNSFHFRCKTNSANETIQIMKRIFEIKHQA